ncbi:MAG: substrate-binding domain-containing protein [Actinobacteria bacterium]|nr:substrate-binding domain-containing protein [Actinomycetota bacterium]
MKKVISSVLIIGLIAAMIFAFSLLGCKQTTAVETTAAATAAESTAATTATETTAAETTAANLDQPDPWISDARAGLKDYRGDITFQGELGQTPNWDDKLELTLGEVEKIKQGNFTVVFNPNGFQADHTDTMINAIKDVCAHTGMKLLATTDSQNDPTKQISDLETLLALKPSVVISGPIDPVSSAATYRKVIDSGAKLVIWSNVPQGFEHGKDYVGVVTANAQGLAQYPVKVLAENVSKNAEIGMMFFDTKFWIVNLIDKIVEETIAKDYPDLKLVAKAGYTDPNKASDVASAMILKNPKIEGIYGDWNLAATGAADAAVQAGRKDIKITCFGVDRPTLVKILKGENFVGTVSDNPYHLGFNLALLAAYGVINKPAPEYTIVPSIPITEANMEKAWEITQKLPFPDELKALLK